jgi:4-aminobutyrate aminotransferase-like enzyme
VQQYLLEHCPVHIDTALTYCHYSLNDTTLLDFLPIYAAKNVGVINASVRLCCSQHLVHMST